MGSAFGFFHWDGTVSPCRIHPSAKKTTYLRTKMHTSKMAEWTWSIRCLPPFTQTRDVNPMKCQSDGYINPMPGTCVPTALVKVADYGPWSECWEIQGRCFKVRQRTEESGSRMWDECLRAPQLALRLRDEYMEAYRLFSQDWARCSDECM